MNHTIKYGVGGVHLSTTKNVSCTAGSGTIISESIAASTTDAEITFVMDVSELKSLWLCSSQDVTVETNSSSAPADTIELKADCPLVWESTTGYFTCPIGTDVTTLYITNAGDTAATIEGEFVHDCTP